MDLSKAFDWIRHELFIVKLATYGLKRTALKHVYSYLKNCIQRFHLRNTSSDFKYIISGFPQGSVAGPILFNAFLNGFFFCIKQASVHSFEDDNKLLSIANTFAGLVRTEAALQWYS